MNCIREALENQKSKVRNWKFVMIFIFSMFGGVSVNAQIIGKSIFELRQKMNPLALRTPNPNMPTFQHSMRFYLPFRHNYLPLDRYTFNRFTNQPQTDIPNPYRYEHLPIFCKFEVKMEQATKFPVKVRLGDVEYVDRLEGKRE